MHLNYERRFVRWRSQGKKWEAKRGETLDMGKLATGWLSGFMAPLDLVDSSDGWMM